MSALPPAAGRERSASSERVRAGRDEVMGYWSYNIFQREGADGRRRQGMIADVSVVVFVVLVIKLLFVQVRAYIK